MDPRDFAQAMPSLFENFDEKRMTCTVELYDAETDTSEDHTVHVVFTVCPTCSGKGSHVNPSIDAHGISSDEFDRDPQFRDEYMSGFYDVPCYRCKGKRVVPTPDTDCNDATLLRRIADMITDRMDYIRECEAERRMGC